MSSAGFNWPSAVFNKLFPNAKNWVAFFLLSKFDHSWRLYCRSSFRSPSRYLGLQFFSALYHSSPSPFLLIRAGLYRNIFTMFSRTARLTRAVPVRAAIVPRAATIAARRTVTTNAASAQVASPVPEVCYINPASN